MAAHEAAVLIENGETVSSNILELVNKTLVGLSIPAAFEGTAITFQAGVSGTARDMHLDASTGSFFPVRDASGNVVTLTVAASRHVTLSADQLRGVMWLKLVAGTAQTGDCTITAVLEPRN